MNSKPAHVKYGQTTKAWDVFKAEARKHMIAAASKRAMITYGDLAAKMTTVAVEPHDPMLWAIIGDVLPLFLDGGACEALDRNVWWVAGDYIETVRE